MDHPEKPKRKLWLWGCGSCLLLLGLSVGVVAVFLFYPFEEPAYPLDGNVSFPSNVKKGDDFEFVVVLTNPTTEPVFIKHVVLHSFLTAPSLFDGARVISVDPVMDSEPLSDARDDVQFAYFQDILPGEILTVTFHLQAENIGVYYANVGVYAKDPLRADPAFITAFHFGTAEIEIKP